MTTGAHIHEGLSSTGRFFCALQRESLEPLVVVEAASAEEAVPRLLHVIEWYQLGKSEEVFVAPCGEPIAGVPTFLEAFFVTCPPRPPVYPAGGNKAIH